mmetsp:Transcript_40463/g.84191  ORF Transcript_40463/g.84191 Transcript_40463/m.84191 type:complete len:80 (+) Transcript_40463:1986-2225(+)
MGAHTPTKTLPPNRNKTTLLGIFHAAHFFGQSPSSKNIYTQKTATLQSTLSPEKSAFLAHVKGLVRRVARPATAKNKKK